MNERVSSFKFQVITEGASVSKDHWTENKERKRGARPSTGAPGLIGGRNSYSAGFDRHRVLAVKRSIQLAAIGRHGEDDGGGAEDGTGDAVMAAPRAVLILDLGETLVHLAVPLIPSVRA